MIEAIGIRSGIVPTMRDRQPPREQRRPLPRRRIAAVDAARIEIDDALAAIDRDAAPPAGTAAAGAPTVTAMAVAQRLAAAADRAVAMQARLGPAAVLRLLGAEA